jgi:hypothetical protein
MEQQVQQGKFFGIMGIHTARAIERLKEGVPGDTITRDEMKHIIGRSCDVNSLGYGNVNSAIHAVERDHGVVWSWDRDKQAWLCLNDGEKLTKIRDLVGSAKRRSSRAIRVTKAVEYTKLNEDQRRDFTVLTAITGMIRLCGGTAFRHQLEKNVDDKLFIEPPSTDLVKLMRS